MKPIKYIALVFSILLLLSTAASAEKFQRGTIFVIVEGGKENYYIVSAYIPSTDSYELTSPTTTITVQRSIVETWKPVELETWYEKLIRGLNLGAIINGVIMPEMYGDIDGNNIIEKPDAVLAVLAYYGSANLNQYQINAADVSPMSGDGKVTREDAVKLVAYYFNDGEPQPDSRIGVLIPNPTAVTPSATAIIVPAPTTITTTPTPTPVVTVTSVPPTPTPTPSVQTGTIIVWSHPDNAKILINDIEKGITTNNQWSQIPMPAGTYTVRVSKDGYETFTQQSVVVSANGQASVQAILSTPTPISTPPPTIPYEPQQTPGFETVLAVIGLLITAHIVLRNEKKE